MSKVILKNVRLSDNPDTKTVNSNEGINGKINQTSDGRLFCILEIEDSTNPFKKSKAVRMYSQQLNGAGKASWPGATPLELLALKGKGVPGQFVTANVQPYEIGDRTVSTYTTFVMPHENVATLFNSQGHPLTGPVANADGEFIESPEAVASVGNM